MENANVCHHCGNKYPNGSKFCNECGHSTTPRTPEKEFVELVDVHEYANLDRAAKVIFGDLDYVLTVEKLRWAIEKLPTDNMRQVFIRVLNLHKPGVQGRQTYSEVALQKKGSKSVVSKTFQETGYRLANYLRDDRRRYMSWSWQDVDAD